MKKNITLRKQFLTEIIAILLIVSILSSIFQLYLMNKQIDYEIDNQASVISQSINQGIKETDLAEENIEKQIDLKMEGYAKHIGDMLNKKEAENITVEDLANIKEQLSLAGISIFTRKGNDIVVVKATDPKEIGFSTRSIGEEIYGTNNKILKGEDPQVPGALSEKGLVVLPIVQSGTHKDEPQFFKYAYYHPKGSDYTINPYIKADEIYKFTQNVGPDSWIQEMEKENPFVKDISVLNPEVFQNPELESQFWPPVKKVVYGDYQFKSKQDLKIIRELIVKPKKKSLIIKQNGQKLLKLFLPLENGHVIHIVLDYEKMTAPLNRQLIILLVTGFVSIISIFLLIYRLFSRIYGSIQKITNQINLLESGDLTAKSNIKDGSELSTLSENVNSMASKLNNLVKETHEQATKTRKLSVLLEKEASHSVEKMYEVSTEATMKAREQLYDITAFLDEVEKELLPYGQNEKVKDILEKMEIMRNVANDRTAATTDTTIYLSDLLRSLHGQSSELSDISSALLKQIGKFKL